MSGEHRYRAAIEFFVKKIPGQKEETIILRVSTFWRPFHSKFSVLDLNVKHHVAYELVSQSPVF